MNRTKAVLLVIVIGSLLMVAGGIWLVAPAKHPPVETPDNGGKGPGPGDTPPVVKHPEEGDDPLVVKALDVSTEAGIKAHCSSCHGLSDPKQLAQQDWTRATGSRSSDSKICST